MLCLTEDNVNQIEIMSSVYCQASKLDLYLLYLRVYASNAHPKHILDFMYFLFSSYSFLPPPPPLSNPTVFLFSANSYPFSFFAAICPLWLRLKWVMSWKISSTSSASPGIPSWLLSSLAFSSVPHEIYAMAWITFG